jgi:redox-sensing transcriptional repressor
MSFKRYIPVESISELTINRLSVYLRCLQQLEQEGTTTVSSQELADRFHLNSAQIRKDLAYFGEFGIRGVGYNVTQLREHLVNILGLHEERRALPLLRIQYRRLPHRRHPRFRPSQSRKARPRRVGRRERL